MSKTKKVQEFLKLLKEDPKVKKALESAKSEPSGLKTRTVVDAFLSLLKVMARGFSKRKLMIFHDVLEITRIIIEISLMIKKNVLDRPEVKLKFEELLKATIGNSSAIALKLRSFIDQMLTTLKKTKKKP